MKLPQPLSEGRLIRRYQRYRQVGDSLYPGLAAAVMDVLGKKGETIKAVSQAASMPGPTLMPIGLRMPLKYSTWAPSSWAVRMPIQGKCVPRLNQPHCRGTWRV